jgi:hypothetical protein
MIKQMIRFIPVPNWFLIILLRLSAQITVKLKKYSMPAMVRGVTPPRATGGARVSAM